MRLRSYGQPPPQELGAAGSLGVVGRSWMWVRGMILAVVGCSWMWVRGTSLAGVGVQLDVGEGYTGGIVDGVICRLG